ncbi:MAG: hypothetical protein K8F91_16225, partial [Candidatus Obscuribacterales bacterium]|nr:hypothetical protein [Candidatus Obscuribacterales bacterium]
MAKNPFAFLFGRGGRSNAPIPLETQLAELESCGIKPNPGVSLDDILLSFSRYDYENKPYELLLTALGSQMKREPHPFMSDDIWHLDAECIEDHGSYKIILERIVKLTGGYLPLTHIEDFVDIEAEKAWMSFRLADKEYKWDARIDNDWLDEKILSKLVDLMKQNSCEKRLTHLD